MGTRPVGRLGRRPVERGERKLEKLLSHSTYSLTFGLWTIISQIRYYLLGALQMSPCTPPHKRKAGRRAKLVVDSYIWRIMGQ